MGQTVQKDRKMLLLSFVTAGVTVIAGIMHLQMVPMSISHDIGEGVLFLVGGALQVFWAVPVIKQWGRVWQIVGILGTAVFSIIWFATHTHNLLGGTGGHMPPGNMSQEFHGNITGGHFPRGPPPTGISSIPQIEYFQMAFIILYAVLSKMISTKKRQAGIPDTDKGKK
ncbi:MAG: hypothetical protein ACREA7_08140 [Nitrosotalea sp.]